MESVWGLKVIGLLMGMQAGFTKYCCFLSGIVELYPSITSRKTRGLEELFFLANTASRRILWWTWIKCFFLLFTSSWVWWRISWRRYTKMVLPSNTCLLCSQILVLLSSKRASLSDLRSEKYWRILILRSFLTLRNWEHGKHSSQSVVASLVTHAYQITKSVLRSCKSLTRIWGAECHSRFIFSISTSTSSGQTLEQWVMSMEKDSTKTLRRWRATIKANGTPAWWETSAGCSCVTSRRQNTPDLRKHTFDYLWFYELCNCVIQVYWFNQCSLSILFYLL